MYIVNADPKINVKDFINKNTMMHFTNITERLVNSPADVSSRIKLFESEKNYHQINDDYINTLGSPVFSTILGRPVTADKITPEDTAHLLKHINIENSFIPRLKEMRPSDIINRDTNKPLLAYISYQIGKCMMAEASLSATTLKSNDLVHLDISALRPEPLQPPKKPNWFVRTFAFLSKSFKEKVEAYNKASETYDSEKRQNEADIARFDDMNSENLKGSDALQKQLIDEALHGKREKNGITQAEMNNANQQLTQSVTSTQRTNVLKMGTK